MIHDTSFIKFVIIIGNLHTAAPRKPITGVHYATNMVSDVQSNVNTSSMHKKQTRVVKSL